MKKMILLVSMFALFLIVPSVSLAHPGNTDSSGCHTCRTNCSSWGLSSGEYHCHNNKGFAQPSYPIHSTYGASGTGYTTLAPDYAYPSSSSIYSNTPSCPINSYASGSSCKCNYGYVASGSSCVSTTSYCSKLIGYMSQYNTLSDTCECMSGYKLNSSGQCVSQQSYCTSTFGYGAEYSYLKSSCVCKTGYVVNAFTNRCDYDTSSSLTPSSTILPSADVYESCQKTYGVNSYSSSVGKCACNKGYVWSDTKTSCVSPSMTSNNQACEKTFGVNSNWDGTKTPAGLLNCGCDTGYIWNTTKSLCLSDPKYLPPGCSLGAKYSSTTGLLCKK